MKKQVRKLRVDRETLRRLDEREQAAARGGTLNTHLCVITRNGYTCPTSHITTCP